MDSTFRQIRTEVSRLLIEGKQRPVLVIDEAHHLRNEVLEDLRLLTLCRACGYAERAAIGTRAPGPRRRPPVSRSA